MTSVSAGHIILTSPPPPPLIVGSGRPERESIPGPSPQELRALPAELPFTWTELLVCILFGMTF